MQYRVSGTYDFKKEAQLLFWAAGTAFVRFVVDGIVRVGREGGVAVSVRTRVKHGSGTHLADFGRSVRHAVYAPCGGVVGVRV